MEKNNQSSEVILASYNVDSCKRFSMMSEDKKNILLDWLKQYILPRKYINNKYSSYYLKHLFENDDKHGFYITNDEFKGAMLASGYSPKNNLGCNWNFKISENSPCISLFSSV